MLKMQPAEGISKYKMTSEFEARVQTRVRSFDPDFDKHPGAVDRQEAVQIGMPGELRALDWLPSERTDCAQSESFQKFPDVRLGSFSFEIRSTAFYYSSVYETARAIIWKEKIYPEFNEGAYLFTLVNPRDRLVFITGWCLANEFINLAEEVIADGEVKLIGGSEVREKDCYILQVGKQRKLATLRPYLLEKGLWVSK
jgi:hypothetical protein